MVRSIFRFLFSLSLSRRCRAGLSLLDVCLCVKYSEDESCCVVIHFANTTAIFHWCDARCRRCRATLRQTEKAARPLAWVCRVHRACADESIWNKVNAANSCILVQSVAEQRMFPLAALSCGRFGWFLCRSLWLTPLPFLHSFSIAWLEELNKHTNLIVTSFDGVNSLDGVTKAVTLTKLSNLKLGDDKNTRPNEIFHCFSSHHRLFRGVESRCSTISGCLMTISLPFSCNVFIICRLTSTTSNKSFCRLCDAFAFSPVALRRSLECFGVKLVKAWKIAGISHLQPQKSNLSGNVFAQRAFEVIEPKLCQTTDRFVEHNKNSFGSLAFKTISPWSERKAKACVLPVCSLSTNRC